MKSFKARLTLRSAVSSGVLAAAVALAFPGCQALPPVSQQAPAAVGDETPMARSFTADVDPLHGAAFLRPEQRSLQALISAPMLIDVNFTSVTHDTSTGITTVSMLVTNAGTALTFLNSNGIKCLANFVRRHMAQPADQRYRLVLRYSPEVTWQRATLKALATMARDAITLEAI